MKSANDNSSEQGYLRKQNATSSTFSFKTIHILLYLHFNVYDNQHGRPHTALELKR